MQYPPAEWLTYFCAVPMDQDYDMKPHMPTDWQLWNGPYYPNQTDFDTAHWIAYDVDERIIDMPPLEFCWVYETFEPRYSTDLLEILYENENETWTKYDIQTLPDRYTEFVLPVDEDRLDYKLHNDYLITTSFIDEETAYFKRASFVFPGNWPLKEGIYVNELVPPIPPPPPGQAPTADFTVTPGTTVDALVVLTFDASSSSDPDGTIVSYEWDFGDGTTAEGMIVTHYYTKANVYTVTLTVTDDDGNTDTATETITVTSSGFRFMLKSGWNQISFPVIPSDTLATIMSSLPGGSQIFIWNANTQSYELPDLSSPPQAGVGYWIYTPSDATLDVIGTEVGPTPYTLLPGWNMIGPGYGEEIITEWAYHWNAEALHYDPATHVLEPGKGYWVWSS
ncbi:MAG: hypothetical protein DRN29_11050 [Thermoplasmata archaeon]|nr:MAG: hypothetical protein DRN29_11050 [Thermoplasmata archaeon]